MSFLPSATNEPDRRYGELLTRRGDDSVHPDFGFAVPEHGFEWRRL